MSSPTALSRMYRFRNGSEARYEQSMESATQEKPSRWRGWLGWLILALGAAERIIGWGGSLDFLVSRSEDPGWLGRVGTFIASNPAYVSFVLILSGVALIVWNERRRTDRLVAAHIGAPVASLPVSDNATTPEPDAKSLYELLCAFHDAMDLYRDGRSTLSEFQMNGEVIAVVRGLMHAKIPQPDLAGLERDKSFEVVWGFVGSILPLLREGDIKHTRVQASAIIGAMKLKALTPWLQQPQGTGSETQP